MKRQKAIIIFISVFFVGIGLYIVLNPTKHVNIETTIMHDTLTENGKEEQTQKSSDDIEVTAESETISDEIAAGEVEEEIIEEDHSLTITEEIKEKVREVLEGAINFFKKDLEIVSIGDSLTQGVGDESENGGYVGILNHTFEDNGLNITIENYGKRGNRTDQLLKRLENEEIVESIKNSEIVLITIGANDIMKIVKNNFTNLNIELFQQEKSGYQDRLRAIFDKINDLNPDAKIYLIGFYNPFEQYLADIVELEMIITNWNEAGRLVTEEYENVNYIPVADLFSQTDVNLLADDYFHPNTSGYKLIAERVLDNLEEIDEETEIRTEEANEESGVAAEEMAE